MKKNMLLCAVIAMAFASAASAEITLKQFEDAKAAGGHDWELVKIYFNGAGNAYKYANLTTQAEHKISLYCPPRNLAVTGQNYLDIIETEIVRASPKFSDDFPIDTLLLHGLAFTFPCK